MIALSFLSFWVSLEVWSPKKIISSERMRKIDQQQQYKAYKSAFTKCNLMATILAQTKANEKKSDITQHNESNLDSIKESIKESIV